VKHVVVRRANPAHRHEYSYYLYYLYALVPTPIVVAIATVPVAVVVTIESTVVAVPTAVIAVPVAVVVPAAIPSRLHPPSAPIRRHAPEAVMPYVSPALRIPVAVHPHVLRTWSARHHAHYARWRRSSDPNVERHLRRRSHTTGQQQSRQTQCRDESLHVVLLSLFV